MRYIIIGSLLLGAGLIVLLSLGASNTEFFAANLPLLLGMTALAALGLAILFGFQVYSLWRRIRAGVFGSRLTARLFWTLGLMSLIPGLIVYGVSVQFIVRSIESWFDVRVEQALESGLALGQSALEHLERDHIKKAEVIAQQLSEMPPVLHISRLNSLRESVGLREITLFDAEGRLLGFASADKADLLPAAPGARCDLASTSATALVAHRTKRRDKSLVIRVVVPVNLVSLTETLRLLQVTQPVPAKNSRRMPRASR
jgi:nitrogen fixation/metabolism regulation signal transduction histidine kinase